MKDINQIAAEVHEANIKWWQDPTTQQPIKRNPFELLMLVVTELSEAVEGERKNLMDDKLPHRKMAEVEMADAKIRLLDFAAGFNYPLCEVVVDEPELAINKAHSLFEITQVVSALDDDVLADNQLAGEVISLAIILINQYCKRHGYDIDGAYAQKMDYNKTRIDHTHEARLVAGGKQF